MSLKIASAVYSGSVPPLETTYLSPEVRSSQVGQPTAFTPMRQALKLVQNPYCWNSRSAAVSWATASRHSSMGSCSSSSINSVFTASEEAAQNVRPVDDFHSFKRRSEEQTSELQSLMRIPSAIFCLQ